MRAKITIFDEETGREFVKDKVIEPTIMDKDYDDFSTTYRFDFRLCIINNKDLPKESLFYRS